MKTGVIILAAGSSSRLGRPKQLLEFQGETLLSKAIAAAKASLAENVVVVLGSQAELIKTGFDSIQTPYVINPDWETGMASSIRTGLNFLQENEDSDQVVLMLCDQPFVDAALIDKLILEKEKSGKGIVACAYYGTFGVPALYDKKYFDDLMNLQGAEGAKKLFKSFSADLESVDFPNGKIDVDTMEDWQKLQS